ncbi:GIY-YIG nuclease family protein [Rhodobacterales bacterium HKCCSP123]|nr:GIY-YIG nuclease family protein [Rhodobacterales bacterium HKCCSP123]
MIEEVVSWTKNYLNIDLVPVEWFSAGAEWEFGDVPDFVHAVVYVFFVDGKVQYVGETIKLKSRIKNHRKQMTKQHKPHYRGRYGVPPFADTRARVQLLVGEVPEVELGGAIFRPRKSAEEALIAKFDPPGNPRR